MEELLNKINLLLQEESIIKREKKKRGEYFNVFEIMHAQSDEVHTHSAIIAALLNPKGIHGCRSVFLSLFMEKLSDLLQTNLELPDYEEYDLEKCKIYVERYAGNLTSGKEEGGRIDIIIEFKSVKRDRDYAVILENKIYANDQAKQLYRYKQFADKQYGRGHYLIIYLTLDGHYPSEDSITSKEYILKDGVDFFRMSYGDFILEWLSACKDKASSVPIVRETITQYYNLIAKMTNRDMETSINEELINMFANRRNISAVFKINQIYNDVLNRVCNTTLLEQIKEIADDLNLHCKCRQTNWCKRWNGQFFFSKHEWRHFCIGFEFMRDNLSDFNYGIRYKEEAEKETLTDVEEKIRKRLTDGRFRQNSWWVFFKPFKYNNWNDDVFIRLYNGEIKLEIKRNVEELLIVLKNIKL